MRNIGKALVLFWSSTGNTEKVANRIAEGLVDSGWDVIYRSIKEEGVEEENFYSYDLICFGIPSINWHVPVPAEKFLKSKFNEYKQAGKIIPGCPKNGRYAMLFCTYSGPHTGINEAIPALKYAGQFFEHFGFTIVDEWYILSEFHGSEGNNTLGRMGDIRGLPSEEDLKRIKIAAANWGKRIGFQQQTKGN